MVGGDEVRFAVELYQASLSEDPLINLVRTGETGVPSAKSRMIGRAPAQYCRFLFHVLF
jgi:hypothetical protein